MVSEARAMLGKLFNEFRVFGSNALHVAAVTSVQDATRHLVTDLVAVRPHLGTPAQHLFRHLERLVHDRRRALFLGEHETFFPAGKRELTSDFLGECYRRVVAVLHAQHRDGGTEAQEAHAMTALALNLIALLR